MGRSKFVQGVGWTAPCGPAGLPRGVDARTLHDTRVLLGQGAMVAWASQIIRIECTSGPRVVTEVFELRSPTGALLGSMPFQAGASMTPAGSSHAGAALVFPESARGKAECVMYFK